MLEKTISGTCTLDQTTCLDKLVIEKDGQILAPEGKFVTMTVNGSGCAIKPGIYYGDIVLTIADTYHMAPHGLMKMMNRSEEFHSALVIKDNEVVKEQSVDALLRGGKVTGECADGITILSNEESFNGIVITGDSHYQVKNSRLHLEGNGSNDFLGVGAGILAIDHSRVSIDNCDLTMSGVTRCAIHSGGDSIIEINDCNISNESPDAPEWMGDFSWGIGVTGSNRLVQLADNGTVYYNRCKMKTNGWGVFSIDGCDDCARIFVKDCDVDLSGPRANGYGAFCIGDRNVVSFDHSRIHVDGYALMVRGMIAAAKAEIINGCEITGNRHGVICIGDNQTPVKLHDSSFTTDRSTLVVKGSSTQFDIRNCKMNAKNNVILQLMDNDEAGMDVGKVKVPDREDVYQEGRDLTAIHPEDDVTVTLSDMDVHGNFFNSTTNLHMELESEKGGVGNPNTFGGLFAPPEGVEGSFMDAPVPEGEKDPKRELEYDKKLRGPKNLALNLKNTRVEGAISSASQTYREGLTWIDEYARLELSNITQKPAPTINNGVIVSLDNDSTWIVTETCYLTGLHLGDHAIMKPQEGHTIQMSVDGKETELCQGGDYTGKIVLTIA